MTLHDQTLTTDHQRQRLQQPQVSVREYVFYVFFSDFKKHDFLRFFEMTFQKNVKSHKKYQVCRMSIEILASKIPDVVGTYRHLSHTVLGCIVSCVHTSEQGV